MGHVDALLASAHVALVRGDAPRSAEVAREAAAAARQRRDRAGLGQALEIQALASSAPDAARSRLEEALGVWREIRDPLGEARSELALARLTGDAAQAAGAEERLRALGARGIAATPRSAVAETAAPPVAVHTLGAFRVLRGGVPVPLTEWQSKKARDVLKILIVRHGRAVPRDALMELLWPDEEPAKLPNRLSVALATVRAVLDPQKAFPQEHFVVAEKNAVRLELANVAVDIEAFLADAEAGLKGGADARERLERAESAYTGAFLEEDAYEDWAQALRDEAEAAYVGVALALAADARERADHDAASRYFLRVLEHDPFDEGAHLGLVATLLDAGRHGEARRFYRDYCTRMDELGIEPAAYPAARERRAVAAA
jgi:DNA-binding SARP family transcriptional activator